METSPPAAQADDSNVPAVTPAESSVPAVAEAAAPAMGFDEPAPAAPGQPVSVAFLPLALIAFVDHRVRHRRLDVPRRRALSLAPRSCAPATYGRAAEPQALHPGPPVVGGGIGAHPGRRRHGRSQERPRRAGVE